MNSGAQLNLSKNCAACSFSPRMYKAAMTASALFSSIGRPQLIGLDASRYGSALSSTFFSLGNSSMFVHVRSMTTSPFLA